MQLVIDIELMGFVEHWGLHINSITVIGKVSSDYSVMFRRSW